MLLIRSQKLTLNTIFSLTNQIVLIVCGFVLPRMFLVSYGSAINGLQASITQFLGFITLCELGVGAVVQAALYKPLAEKNYYQISQIVCSSNNFFHKLGLLLIVYTIGLICFYPFLIKQNFGLLYTTSLILIISLSSFGYYFLGVTYRTLLNADQLAFIPIGLQMGSLIVSTIVSVILMKLGFSIHEVKLADSFIFLIPPFILSWYVHRHYPINYTLKLSTEPLKQKWNGIAQHISIFVLDGTDILVLTIFSTLQTVSIYTVYNLVIMGIKQFMYAITSGMQATFGDMIAKQEKAILISVFSQFEWVMHSATTFLFVMTGLLIIPFVQVYTQGITDANYILPTFAFLMVLAQGIYCIRLPYNMIILSAGHFKETQTNSFIEAGLNIVLSVLLVFHYGLIGVAIGTLVAVISRTVYLAWYLSHHILERELTHFKKHILVDLIIILVMVLCTHSFKMANISYWAWFILACKTGTICLLVSAIFNWIFYRHEIIQLYLQVRSKLPSSL